MKYAKIEKTAKLKIFKGTYYCLIINSTHYINIEEKQAQTIANDLNLQIEYINIKKVYGLENT